MFKRVCVGTDDNGRSYRIEASGSKFALQFYSDNSQTWIESARSDIQTLLDIATDLAITWIETDKDIRIRTYFVHVEYHCCSIHNCLIAVERYGSSLLAQ